MKTIKASFGDRPEQTFSTFEEYQKAFEKWLIEDVDCPEKRQELREANEILHGLNNTGKQDG